MWLVASLVAVYSSSFVETLHILGNYPVLGLLLMHCMPEIYLWIKRANINIYLELYPY
jgi:hypothetical protein